MRRIALLSTFLLAAVPFSFAAEQADFSINQRYNLAVAKMEGQDRPGQPATLEDTFAIFSEALESPTISVRDKIICSFNMADLHLREHFQILTAADVNTRVNFYGMLVRCLLCVDMLQTYKNVSPNTVHSIIGFYDFCFQNPASYLTYLNAGQLLTTVKTYASDLDRQADVERAENISMNVLGEMLTLAFSDDATTNVFSMKAHLYLCGMAAENLQPLPLFKLSDAYISISHIINDEEPSLRLQAKAMLYRALLAHNNRIIDLVPKDVGQALAPLWKIIEPKLQSGEDIDRQLFGPFAILNEQIKQPIPVLLQFVIECEEADPEDREKAQDLKNRWGYR
jgi:hypothetical protein